MITILPETIGYTLAVKADGKLTAADYETVFIPELEKLIKQFGQVRLLLQFDAGFSGWEAGAAWDDAKFGMKHRHDFKRIAIVGGPKWVAWAAKLGAHLLDGEVRVFEAKDLPEAGVWVKT